MAPIQFKTMVLESYDMPKDEGDNPANKEFVFPFNQESEVEVSEMFAFHNDNRNTYNL